MKPMLQAVRAIGSEFGRRALRPWLIGGAVVVFVLVALGVWLVTVNVWWWLFLVPVLVLAFIFSTIAAAVEVVVKVIDSVQSAEQRRAVRSYVDVLQRVAEKAQTPWQLLLYNVVRDVVFPNPDGIIATMSRDSRTLAPDFAKLIRLFEESRYGFKSERLE